MPKNNKCTMEDFYEMSRKLSLIGFQKVPKEIKNTEIIGIFSVIIYRDKNDRRGSMNTLTTKNINNHGILTMADYYAVLFQLEEAKFKLMNHLRVGHANSINIESDINIGFQEGGDYID